MGVVAVTYCFVGIQWCLRKSWKDLHVLQRRKFCFLHPVERWSGDGGVSTAVCLKVGHANLDRHPLMTSSLAWPGLVIRLPQSVSLRFWYISQRLQMYGHRQDWGFCVLRIDWERICRAYSDASLAENNQKLPTSGSWEGFCRVNLPMNHQTGGCMALEASSCLNVTLYLKLILVRFWKQFIGAIVSQYGALLKYISFHSWSY